MLPPNENAHAGEQWAHSQNKQADSSDNRSKSQPESAKATMSCGFTVLRTPKRLCKRFYRGVNGIIEKEDYSKATYFKASVIKFSNIHELALRVGILEKDNTACAIRGTPKAGSDLECILRRYIARNGIPAPMLDIPRRWVMIDVDGIPCPAATDPAIDPEDALGYVLSLLPPEFSDVSCYWQFSASQGMKGDTLSMHLWFFLDRPYSNVELRKYANRVNKDAGRKLIDPALFNPVQPHYTAAPIFEGVCDPLPKRSGFWQGLENTATLNIPTEDDKKPSYKAAASYCPGLGYQGYLADIGDDKDGFYRPIVSAIASYVGSNGVEGTDSEAIKADIRATIDAASAGNRSSADIERYKSDKFLDDIFIWVFEREREKPKLPEFTTSLPPYFSLPSLSATEASQGMRVAISEFVKKAVRWARGNAL